MALPKVWLNLEPHPSVFEVLEGKAQIIGPLVRPDTGDPLSEIEEAEAVLASTDFPANRTTFERATNLKVVARYGIGLDSVDVAAATDCGICVVHTPDAPTIPVAEITIALILAVYRKILELDKSVRRGAWQSKDLLGYELQGKTVGLVGMGRIGRRVARILQAFESEVIIFDPYVGAEAIRGIGAKPVQSLELLLTESDVVSLHLPLTTATRGLLGRQAFSLMKTTAVLINVARGAIVDEGALIEALAAGRIAGAGLDVFEKEPPAPDNPLLAMDNVVLAPHAGAFTWEGKSRSNPGAAAQALQVLMGERPPFLANPEVWTKRRGL
ncbi:MAG: hydroxyacid dehydrogenase [Verrucomicrobia bacterium]|nr:hydroxyacid dehydrogenase [Verrucomicrobiota bacterium]